jgi:hypothetical protein
MKRSRGVARTPSESDFDKFEVIAQSAFSEFEDVADFVWKSPRLIEAETKSEIEKLTAYFPLTGSPQEDDLARKLRKARWFYESRKLAGVFPNVMAKGNFFTALSLLESYILMICQEIDQQRSLSLKKYPGRGIGKYWQFLSDVPIELKMVSFNEQIRAAITLRNCLFHANGVLLWSKNPEEVKQIVRERTYWADYTRAKTPKTESNDVFISKGTIGEQLVIVNDYVHIVANYLKFFVVDLCKHAQTACSGERTINLPSEPFYLDKMRRAQPDDGKDESEPA